MPVGSPPNVVKRSVCVIKNITYVEVNASRAEVNAFTSAEGVTQGFQDWAF